MFTGIVQGTATLRDIVDQDGLRHLTVGFPAGALAGVQTGASIALCGVCLTVVAFDGDTARFDVIDETLRRTTLGDKVAGQAVNFERAARFGDEIGGHNLSGHIAGVLTVERVDQHQGNVAMTLGCPREWLKYVLEKGYVGIDGCSLTIGTVDREASTFMVHLIPETLRLTTLDAAQPGTRLNLEVDALTQAAVDTVERVLAQR